MKAFIQHSPPHAGEILQEYYLEPLGLTISDAAKKLLITRPNLSSIVNGKAGLSPLMAVKLSKAFNTSPQYWMNIQASHDLWEVMKKEKNTISEVEQLV
jgi:addiction module HigA family antidote